MTCPGCRQDPAGHAPNCPLGPRARFAMAADGSMLGTAKRGPEPDPAPAPRPRAPAPAAREGGRGLYPTRTEWEACELFAFLTTRSMVQLGRCEWCGWHREKQGHRWDCPLVPR